MPIYEFHCSTCGGDFEQLFRSSDASAATCPDCGSQQVERKLSLFGMSSSRADGSSPSAASGCASCQATSCAGCRR